MFNIGGIQKTTLVDFPQKIAAIVFTQGCNFRCGYCHNPELLSQNNLQSKYNPQEFLDFLKSRTGKLDGVVITGGEPTLQVNLYNFIREVKQLGFLVKLDTNGTNPEILQKLINDKLLDYIAMDIKAPLDKYSLITGVNTDCEKLKKSIVLVMKSGVDYEFRTTVIKSQLLPDDFNKIGQLINGAKRYYLQKFVPSKIFDEKLETETTYTNQEFDAICANLKKYIDIVEYR